MQTSKLTTVSEYLWTSVASNPSPIDTPDLQMLHVYVHRSLRLRSTPQELPGIEQWNSCTLPFRINGDVSLTYLQQYLQGQSPPYHEGVLGHRTVCYYGGGSRRTQRKPPGCSANTNELKRFQQINLQVKVKGIFDQSRHPLVISADTEL